MPQAWAQASRQDKDKMSVWLSRFNPTPSFPRYSGPYDVGTVDFETPASELRARSASDAASPDYAISTIAFRVFYPCDTPTKPSCPVHWVQPPQQSVLSAYARFLGANSVFSDIISYFPRLLYWIQLPVHREAPLATPTEKKGRWPVLIFSHGLGGSRNSYSHLCASLASYGIVVIATEHRDGSSPVSHVQATDQTTAYAVPYRRISHKPSPEVYRGRDEQLRVRLWELTQTFEALLLLDSGVSLSNIAPDAKRRDDDAFDLASILRDALDIHAPGRVSWAGHSFGAATTVQFVKSVYYSTPSSHSHLLPSNPPGALKSQITRQTPAILLDLWALPLQSPDSAQLKSRPMPCFNVDPGSNFATSQRTISTLAVLSEAFVDWSTNLRHVKSALSDPSRSTSGAHVFYPEKSAHLSQSDFGILFPLVTKYLAKAEEPARTLRLNIRAILQVLRTAGLPVAPTPAADLELESGANGNGRNGKTNGTKEKASRDEKRNVPNASDLATTDDWRILSRQADVVRGWISLDAEPEQTTETDREDSSTSHESTSQAAVDAKAARNSRARMMRRHSSWEGTFGDTELKGMVDARTQDPTRTPDRL